MPPSNPVSGCQTWPLESVNGADRPALIRMVAAEDAAPVADSAGGTISIALSDAVRFFHMNALSSAVGLKVDFDMALLVLARGLYRLVAQRMRGYGDAQARQIFRDLINMPADVEIGEKEVSVSFHRRAHLPIILASDLVEKPVTVPWWNGFPLRLTTYNGPKT